MPGRMEFNFDLSPQKQGLTERSADAPFRILVLGDFSGRGNRGILEPGDALARRQIHKVDVDTLEGLPQRLKPAVQIPTGDAGSIAVSFGSLDAFHPDHLWRDLPAFQALRDLRARLSNPATYDAAAQELGLNAPRASEAPTTEAPPSESEDNLFSRLLGRAPSEAPAPRTGTGFDVSRFIQQVVSEHVVPAENPGAADAVAQVDAAAALELRRVLHAPAFRALEASWRSLHGLASSVETDETLGIGLLDLSRDELLAEARTLGQNPAASGLHRVLVEATERPGAGGWSVIVADFQFGSTSEDLTALAALGALGSRLRAPVLVGVKPTVLGASSAVQLADPGKWELNDAATAWSAFRALPPARWIGALAPRLLQRLPYGADTDALDELAFEECRAPGLAEDLLWGSPAYGAARLLAEAFRLNGWDMEPGDRRDIDDVPPYVYARDDEKHLMPAAEVFLSERAAEAMLRAGVMPLMSAMDRSLARIIRFQSAAAEPSPLPGPWA